MFHIVILFLILSLKRLKKYEESANALQVAIDTMSPGHQLRARLYNELGGALAAVPDLSGAKDAYERAIVILEEDPQS